MRTNNFTMAFVNGNMIDISNRQVELFEKFDKKHNKLMYKSLYTSLESFNFSRNVL